MQERRSWLCPTELDRMRVVEASDRVRRARGIIAIAIAIFLVAALPWYPPWALALFVPGGLVILLLERWLARTARPERVTLGAQVFILALWTVGVAVTGGPRSPALPLMIIPALFTAMRFRAAVVAAFSALVVAAALIVTLGLHFSATIHDPAPLFAMFGLLICVQVTNWALVEAEMTQRDAAVLDPLTGLLNRKALDTRAMELEQQARLSGGSVALIACDLDNFKEINDAYGHDRGDKALRSAAYLMRKTLRTFELIYRLGGEEFLIVLPGSDLAAATEIAERLRRTVEASNLDGLQLTASFGVAAAAGEQVVYQQLYKLADTALYRAKAAGRNQVIAAGGLGAGAKPPVGAPG